MSPHGPSAPQGGERQSLVQVFRYTRSAVGLVWQTSAWLTVAMVTLTIVGGLLPAAAAWIGKQIVDAVVAAQSDGGGEALETALRWVALEGLVFVGIAACSRGISVAQSLLRALLGHRVNVMILEKALTLDLRHFEDASFYDKLTRARRQASMRPLGLVTKTFGLVQNGISLASYGALLWQFSPVAVALLAVAGVPAFLVETKFSGDAFRLFRWRSPEARKQMYLETVLAREDYVKEVKLFGLGETLLSRYREIFRGVYADDRALTLRRGFWGFWVGLVSTLAFYGAYGWIVMETVGGRITLGEMTMYLLLFKQGQAAVGASLSAIGGMYEDNLYLSNLYEYLAQVPDAVGGEAKVGERPGDGIRFEDVSFTYPGASAPALDAVSFHLRPGQALALVGENGSGKTTLIKLLARLYAPSKGRITLDGTCIEDWEPQALRQRIGVIFQDFARYQLLVGENIGVGDVDHLADEPRWEAAAQLGMAAPFIEEFERGYQTQLGRWFEDGRELSGGQWQKVALSRAFMRAGSDLLVLDEPTAAMDAEAEATVFEHVKGLSRDKMAILISHRFSTVRSADHILVLDGGKILERGSHDELVRSQGRYARLFDLQAAGYR